MVPSRNFASAFGKQIILQFQIARIQTHLAQKVLNNFGNWNFDKLNDVEAVAG